MRRNERQRLFEHYGPWALITGASSGIGAAMARQLAAADFRLVLVARRGDPVAGELRSDYGVEVEVVPRDLSTASACESLIRETEPLPIGLAVLSAGFGGSGRLIDRDLDAELNMVEVNVSAVLALSHAFGRRFAAMGRGGLVLMSSVVGFQGAPFAANYAATKAYVQSLAEALSHELAPLGVDVLSSAPGPVGSGFAQRAAMRMGRTADPERVASASLRALGRRGTVHPGWLSKGLGGSLSCLPRPARVSVMKRVMRGMMEPENDSSKATRLVSRGEQP